jgi:hypothetical protein
MSFHLEGPWLSTTGRRKAKQKYASSEHKRQAEANAAEWQRKVGEFGKLSPTAVKPRGPMPSLSKSLPRTPPGRTTAHIESLVTTWPPCLKAEDKKYTGTKIKGIGTMHKSNAVPVFSDEEAVEISKMRR